MRRMMAAWPEPCPHCGSYRLIGRETVVAVTGVPGLPLALCLRYWRYRHRPGTIVRWTFHCELCGCQWAREAWQREDQG